MTRTTPLASALLLVLLVSAAALQGCDPSPASAVVPAPDRLAPAQAVVDGARVVQVIVHPDSLRAVQAEYDALPAELQPVMAEQIQIEIRDGQRFRTTVGRMNDGSRIVSAD